MNYKKIPFRPSNYTMLLELINISHNLGQLASFAKIMYASG